MTVKEIKEQLDKFPDDMTPVIFNVSENRFYEINSLATIKYWEDNDESDHLGIMVVNSPPEIKYSNTSGSPPITKYSNAKGECE